jgi:energy-coupling factor transporter ATP-binding protein EcfA2
MAEAISRVGLSDFAAAYPRQLSGGMKMRASIARALVTEPRLLLMDEPFAALDEITRFKLNNDLLALWQELRRTVIFVTHSVFESVYLSQRVVVMTARPGRVFDEVAIPVPYPRDERFRTSAVKCQGGGAVMSDHGVRFGLPLLLLVFVLALWQALVVMLAVPPYVLPAPSLVLNTLVSDGALLWQSLLVTLVTTFEARLFWRQLAASGWRSSSANRASSNTRFIPMP